MITHNVWASDGVNVCADPLRGRDEAIDTHLSAYNPTCLGCSHFAKTYHRRHFGKPQGESKMEKLMHIRYLTDQKPICEDPDRLGQDLVVSSATLGNSCTLCNALLYTYNKNEFARDYNRATLSYVVVPPEREPEKGLTHRQATAIFWFWALFAAAIVVGFFLLDVI